MADGKKACKVKAPSKPREPGRAGLQRDERAGVVVGCVTRRKAEDWAAATDRGLVVLATSRGSSNLRPEA